MTTSLTLDTGGLIALERNDAHIRALLAAAAHAGSAIRIPAGALAQAWRAHPRQHVLHVLLGRDNVTVVPLDTRLAMAAGVLCASTGTHDVVDASVAVTAGENLDIVVTSDPDDIRALDPTLVVFAV